jgi:uncharacterized membrane protein
LLIFVPLISNPLKKSVHLLSVFIKNIPPMFSLFSRKPAFFSADEQQRIVAAIKQAEQATSGEIRLFVESRNAYVDPIDRAKEIFEKLKMYNTRHRNAVLLYIAIKDHQLALLGDEGIYQRLGADYWHAEVKEMLQQFKEQHICVGIIKCVSDIGEALKKEFPYTPDCDKNELPDDIVFGK